MKITKMTKSKKLSQVDSPKPPGLPSAQSLNIEFNTCGARMVQFVNLMNICVDAALKVAKTHDWSLGTPEGRKEVESVRTCFFNQGSKEGMLDRMPIMLVDRKKTGKK